jgi:hydroxyacylglutathione hydrolase
MNVIRFYVPGSYENYNHILLCPDTRQALIVDPFDATLATRWLSELDATLVGILITHEHGDHIRGLSDLLAVHNVPVWGHKDIPGVSNPIADGDPIALGNHQLTALFTPGHTFQHFCFLGQSAQSGPFLICADTLFNGGVGNCRSGDVGQLYNSICRLHTLLSDDTAIYPAHDYLCHNLGFAALLEPDNQRISDVLADNASVLPEQRAITHWGLEKEINPFLRLDSSTLKRELNKKTAASLDTPADVFRALRHLRDQW